MVTSHFKVTTIIFQRNARVFTFCQQKSNHLENYFFYNLKYIINITVQFFKSSNKLSKWVGMRWKTKQAIKSEKLFRKTVSSTWALKEKEKTPQASLASCTFTEKGREGGCRGSRSTCNFKRHCLGTRNEEKRASMLYDYLRTGLAR